MPTEMPGPLKDRKAEWSRTEVIGQRLRDDPNFTPPRPEDPGSPYGRYTGRRIIGSHMDHIIGGVYLGAGAREAIVVDDTLNGKRENAVLNNFYRQDFLPHLERIAQNIKATPKNVALKFIFDITQKEMPANLHRTEAVVRSLTKGIKDQKVHLSAFLENHTGVCRHQALLVAYLLEKLQQEKAEGTKLTGTFSLDRNSMAFADEQQIGAHVWVRYTTRHGDAWIIDATQNHIGRLEDLMKDPTVWEYARPAERINFERTGKPK